jgi:hypothetical protein
VFVGTPSVRITCKMNDFACPQAGSCDSGSPDSEALNQAKTIKKCNTTNCNALPRGRSSSLPD